MSEKTLKYIYIGLLIATIPLFLLSPKTTNETNEKKPNISAEQVGSSPESGATSRLKQAYDALVSLGEGYGDSQPSDYPYGNKDHGTYWNRILYSAFWEPDGTATESDVYQDKTFYSQNSRTLKTGTAQVGTSPGAYYEQFVAYDDYHASDYTGEESQWIQTSSATSAHVWQDTRTGLYWSYSLGSYTNSFTQVSTGGCTFFSSTPRSSYTSSNTVPACGNAINACATLSLASTEGQSAKTDWYLPSQKELQRAYRNGIYNQAGSTFTTTSYFWSSTEYSSDSTYAWYVYLRNGTTDGNLKTNSIAARCVRRD